MKNCIFVSCILCISLLTFALSTFSNFIYLVSLISSNFIYLLTLISSFSIPSRDSFLNFSCDIFIKKKCHVNAKFHTKIIWLSHPAIFQFPFFSFIVHFSLFSPPSPFLPSIPTSPSQDGCPLLQLVFSSSFFKPSFFSFVNFDSTLSVIFLLKHDDET